MKEHFSLNPDIIFLNHGSFGATPKPVFEAYQNWQRELEYQPVEFLGRRAGDLLEEARAALADFVYCQPDEIVYATNPTTAINFIIRSLDLQDRG
jgi:isopenicillin-N epimerase